MRAVPKGERGALRQPGEDELFREWKERLLLEELEPAETRYAQLEEACRNQRERLYSLPEWWAAPDEEGRQSLPEARRLEEMEAERDKAWQEWNKACLDYAEKSGFFA